MNIISQESLLNFYRALNISLKAMLGILIVMIIFYIIIILLSKAK
ncbi:hypothetical protein SAMN05443428_10367 [Caloramator quimbayensis]|uniref:Uncharacterized protein n=1 Tax=Caloramator quimbayensis TaxID=1147123 RepID=A0A1T4WRH8_9CLOT|nr:hypothetical protein [Caloramator quimbayensis]SKA79458.1 hypothetical protein SAMN05443428_10367 [Caloramator quimbayensis]